MAPAALSTVAARILLVLGAATCAIGMVGPFQGVEEALIPWDKAAHFTAFYLLTSLLIVAFPTRRRLDLATLAVFAGAAVEVAQEITGRDAGFGDVAANALGALAVLAPTWLDRLTAAARAQASGAKADADRRRRLRVEIPTAAARLQHDQSPPAAELAPVRALRRSAKA